MGKNRDGDTTIFEKGWKHSGSINGNVPVHRDEGIWLEKLDNVFYNTVSDRTPSVCWRNCGDYHAKPIFQSVQSIDY